MNIKADKNKPVIIDGGLNVSKISSQIDDNQASDMLNFWLVDGALKFRPAVIQKITQTYGQILDVYPKNGEKILIKRVTDTILHTVDEMYGFYIVTANTVLAFDGTNIYQIPSSAVNNNGTWSYQYGTYNITVGKIVHNKYINETYSAQDGYTYKLEGNSVIILGAHDYTNKQEIIIVRPSVIEQPGNFPDFYSIGNYFIEYVDAFVPTTYINLTPAGSGNKSQDRNILTPKIKVQFTTNATDKVYHLPEQNIDNDTVTAVYNNLAGTTLTFTFYSGFTSDREGEITATLDRTAGTITFSTALTNASAANGSNNMTVTYEKTFYPAPTPIDLCSITSWFGGTYQGETTGNRLFVSGNPNEPTTVRWSDVDNASYFPESNCYTVGEPSDPVTAFGKMFDIMAVFKKSSTHAISYDYQVASSSVTSGTFGTSLFPVKEVSATIGCDIPGSIQIINSKLVWANTKGGVYTLESTTVKDERVVREISKNVRNLLLSKISTDAVSIDTGKYYILFTQDKAFAWDYNSSAFIDYSDTDKAQNRLSWYYWNLPITPSVSFFIGSDIWLVNSSDSSLYMLDDSQYVDTAGWFDAYIVTKYFNFNLPGYAKNVYLVEISLSNKDDAYVELSSEDCYGESEAQEIYLEQSDTERMVTEKFSPDSLWSEYFSVTVKRPESENSYFNINQMVMYYKVGGRA